MFFLTFFGSLFGVLYFYFTTRNRERLAMIEKNADPAIFKTEPTNVFKKFSIKIGNVIYRWWFWCACRQYSDCKSPGLKEPVAYHFHDLHVCRGRIDASYFVARKVD